MDFSWCCVVSLWCSSFYIWLIIINQSLQLSRIFPRAQIWLWSSLAEGITQYPYASKSLGWFNIRVAWQRDHLVEELYPLLKIGAISLQYPYDWIAYWWWNRWSCQFHWYRVGGEVTNPTKFPIPPSSGPLESWAASHAPSHRCCVQLSFKDMYQRNRCVVWFISWMLIAVIRYTCLLARNSRRVVSSVHAGALRPDCMTWQRTICVAMLNAGSRVHRVRRWWNGWARAIMFRSYFLRAFIEFGGYLVSSHIWICIRPIQLKVLVEGRATELCSTINNNVD